MPGSPATCDVFLSRDFVLRTARRRARRERLRVGLVLAGTIVVLTGLLSIPLYLIWALLPWAPLPPDAWARLGVLAAGTVRAAACAMIVALPLGLATAMFTAHYAAPRLRAVIKPALEILEAIPTVVFGLIAAATLAPWLKLNVATVLALAAAVPAALLAAGLASGVRTRREGWLPLWLLPLVVALVSIGVAYAARVESTSIVPAMPWNAMLVGLALGVAAMPTVFSVAEDALFLVPREHAQAAFALGATRWQALTRVLLPAAGSGLVAAGLLGVLRCLGETMIVLMASGNTPIGGFDPLVGLRSLSAEIALGLPEAAPYSVAWRGLLLAALALLLSTVLFSLLAEAVRERLRRRLRHDGGAS